MSRIKEHGRGAILRGVNEICLHLQMPWRGVLCLAEFESLPLVYESENQPILKLADLEVWQMERQDKGKG